MTGKRKSTWRRRAMRRIRGLDMARRVSTAMSRAQERLAYSSPCEDTKRVQLSPQRRAWRFIARTKRRSLPETCTASAIAASLPETSSSPLSSVSSAHPPALRQQAHAGAAVAQRGRRDPDGLVGPRALDHQQRGHDLRQAGDRRARASGSRRHSTSPVCRRRRRAPPAAACGSGTWNASTPASGTCGTGSAGDSGAGGGRLLAEAGRSGSTASGAAAAPVGRRRPRSDR